MYFVTCQINKLFWVGKEDFWGKCYTDIMYHAVKHWQKNGHQPQKIVTSLDVIAHNVIYTSYFLKTVNINVE